MSVCPDDLLKLASELVDATDEVSWRAAVSRAYYAAYHGCLIWHAAMPAPGSVSGNPGGVHSDLINQLKNGAREWATDHKTKGRVFSHQLSALKARRTVADYYLNESFDQALAATNCASAGMLVSQL